MPTQLRHQHPMLLGNRRVAVHPAPAINGGQGPPEAVLRRLSLEHPAAGPGESPVVREPQNVERAGWWESVTVLPRAPTTSRSAERDQTTLRRVHREAKAPEAFRQHVPHPVGVRFLLEDNDHVVRIADEDASATETRLHLRREPHIEHMVEVDVRQQRRHYSPNAKGNFQFERVIVGWRVRQVLDLRRKQ